MKSQHTLPSLVEYDYTDPAAQQAIANVISLFPFTDQETERRAYVFGFVQGVHFKEIHNLQTKLEFFKEFGPK